MIFQFIEKFYEVKEATRNQAKPNGTTPTTSASASPVASRAVNKGGGGGGGELIGVPNQLGGGGQPVNNQQIVVGGGGGPAVGVPTSGDTFNTSSSTPSIQQNQNEVNLNSNLLLKSGGPTTGPHQRSQSLSGMLPVILFEYRAPTT